MNAQTHNDFLDIVLKGTRANKGMGNFEGILSVEQAEAIHAFLIELGWKGYRQANPAPGSHQPEIE